MDGVRKTASALLLVVSAAALLATSPAPDPRDVSDRLYVPTRAIEAGNDTLSVAMSDAAASGELLRPLEVSVRVELPHRVRGRSDGTPMSLVTSAGERIPLERTRRSRPRDNSFELAWQPPPCKRACIHTARLDLDAGAFAPRFVWPIEAGMFFADEDRVGHIMLGIGPSAATQVFTSRSAFGFGAGFLPGRGVLLTRDRSSAHQFLEFRIERDELPGPPPPIGGSTRAVWAGGAMDIDLSGDDARFRARLSPQGSDPIDITSDGPTTGFGDLRFEVPLRMKCSAVACVGRMTATFELTQGEWASASWSNTTEGLRTVPQGKWVPRWTLSPVGGEL